MSRPLFSLKKSPPQAPPKFWPFFCKGKISLLAINCEYSTVLSKTGWFEKVLKSSLQIQHFSLVFHKFWRISFHVGHKKSFFKVHFKNVFCRTQFFRPNMYIMARALEKWAQKPPQLCFLEVFYRFFSSFFGKFFSKFLVFGRPMTTDHGQVPKIFFINSRVLQTWNLPQKLLVWLKNYLFSHKNP